jgi:hypothetical protein
MLLLAFVALTAGMVPVTSSAGEGEGRFKFGGSMRGRYELFRFSRDETETKKSTRGRIRYRFRLDGKITINTRASFKFRLVSGNDSRSGNQTIGDPVDFGPNNFAIRTAMMTLTPWADGRLPNDKGYWGFDFGRVTNPFVWKNNGRDMMLWDNDIALGGISTVFNHKIGEPVLVFVNAGWYQIDENSDVDPEKDPYFGAAQIGFTGGGDKSRAGIRGTYYYFAELDSMFVARGAGTAEGVTSAGGNIPDGLTGSVYGGKLNVVSTQAFASTRWVGAPFTLYGGYSTNLSAEPSQLFPEVGKENIAYNIGLEGGSRKALMKLGIAWFYIEANAFPSQFIDSDFLDGHTNRKGALVYFNKQVIKNTDFNVQLFGSDAIKAEAGLESSVENSERVRLQVDLLYRF